MHRLPRRRSATVSLVALVATPILTAAADAGFTGYLKIPDIEGESERAGYEGWSEVHALQVDVGLLPPASGSTRTAPSIAVSFAMEPDRTYPYLTLGLLQGLHFEEFEFHQVNEIGQAVIEHVFEGVMLESLQLTQTSSGARLVGELGGVEFYEATYHETDEFGESVQEHVFGYDFEGGVAAVSAPLPGDYNNDGVVDESDHARWVDQYGMTMVTLGGGADGNADGSVDAADYTVWRDAYIGGVQQPFPVPEPAAAGLAALGLSLLSTARRRRFGRLRG